MVTVGAVLSCSLNVMLTVTVWPVRTSEVGPKVLLENMLLAVIVGGVVSEATNGNHRTLTIET